MGWLSKIPFFDTGDRHIVSKAWSVLLMMLFGECSSGCGPCGTPDTADLDWTGLAPGWSQALWWVQAEVITWQSIAVTQVSHKDKAQKGHALLLLPVSPFSKPTGSLGMERSQEHSPDRELPSQGHRALPKSWLQDPPPPGSHPIPPQKTLTTLQPQWSTLSSSSMSILHLFFSLPTKDPSQAWKLFILKVSD